jgi:hypothetical protein
MWGWHFLQEDRRLHFEPHTQVVSGQKLSVLPEKLKMCRYGLHFSENILDALQYAPGPIVCRVQASGRILTDSDKCCAEHRKVVWMVDADRVLREFALWCAEEALKLVKEPDPRSLKALEVKRSWLDGKATDEELAAAWDAAWDAASAASAAWAARDASVARAARAAWAARDASSAAWAASAARATQSKQLLKMIKTIR